MHFDVKLYVIGEGFFLFNETGPGVRVVQMSFGKVLFALKILPTSLKGNVINFFYFMIKLYSLFCVSLKPFGKPIMQFRD